MLAMDNEQWFNRVCKIPSNLKDWLHYEIDDRDPAIPYSAHHEHAPENCIQILPNIATLKRRKVPIDLTWLLFLFEHSD